MKKIVLAFLIVFNSSITSRAQIFSQNFNSSTVLTDYYNASPTTNQFRAIAATTGATVSVSTNALVLTRGTAGNAYAERNVDFSTIPSGMKFQFSFCVSGGGAATSAILVAVGTDVTNGIAAPTNSNIFARFAISTTANSGEFIIKDITNSATGTSTFAGTQTITWILNNTGSTQSYTAPTGSSAQIANGKADIWVGNTREFNNVSVETPTNTLARFKFYTNAWVNGTVFTIDEIVINNESALPVELTSFTSNVVDNEVTLKWSTATEVNNYGFEIQRLAVSDQRSVWEKIGFVQGHGNSNSPKNYSFIDEPTGGKEFQYRLKQIDFNGAFEYSEITTAILENVSEFKLDQNYPNPFNPMTRISYTLPVRTSVKLRVYDLLAQVIAELVNGIQEAGRYEVTFDGSNLPSGAYFYKLEAGSYIEVKKLLLVK